MTTCVMAGMTASGLVLFLGTPVMRRAVDPVSIATSMHCLLGRVSQNYMYYLSIQAARVSFGNVVVQLNRTL